MIRFVVIGVLGACVLLTTAVHAQAPLIQCRVTSALQISFPSPYNIPNRNELTNVSGEVHDASKHIPTLVAGRVLDEDCLPVTGARVVLWHRDHQPSDVKETTITMPPTYAGEAYTDNRGEFIFFTQFPPHTMLPDVKFPMNIRVMQSDFRTLETQIYLPGTVVDLLPGERDSLIAKRYMMTGSGKPVYSYTLVLPAREEQTKQF